MQKKNKTRDIVGKKAGKEREAEEEKERHRKESREERERVNIFCI